MTWFVVGLFVGGFMGFLLRRVVTAMVHWFIEVFGDTDNQPTTRAKVGGQGGPDKANLISLRRKPGSDTWDIVN
jgi:hypothetical protein